MRKQASQKSLSNFRPSRMVQRVTLVIIQVNNRLKERIPTILKKLWEKPTNRILILKQIVGGLLLYIIYMQSWDRYRSYSLAEDYIALITVCVAYPFLGFVMYDTVCVAKELILSSPEVQKELPVIKQKLLNLKNGAQSKVSKINEKVRTVTTCVKNKVVTPVTTFVGNKVRPVTMFVRNKVRPVTTFIQNKISRCKKK